MKVYAALVALLLFPGIPYASGSTGFGTLQMSKEAKIVGGQTADFSVLLVNRGSDPLFIEFSVARQPEGFSVSFSQNRFSLMPHEQDTGDIFHAVGSGYIRMHPVHVRIDVPVFTNAGDYDFKVRVAAKTSGQSGLAFFQERELDFRVVVEKPRLPPENESPSGSPIGERQEGSADANHSLTDITLPRILTTLANLSNLSATTIVKPLIENAPEPVSSAITGLAARLSSDDRKAGFLLWVFLALLAAYILLRGYSRLK